MMMMMNPGCSGSFDSFELAFGRQQLKGLIIPERLINPLGRRLPSFKWNYLQLTIYSAR